MTAAMKRLILDTIFVLVILFMVGMLIYLATNSRPVPYKNLQRAEHPIAVPSQR